MSAPDCMTTGNRYALILTRGSSRTTLSAWACDSCSTRATRSSPQMVNAFCRKPFSPMSRSSSASRCKRTARRFLGDERFEQVQPDHRQYRCRHFRRRPVRRFIAATRRGDFRFRRRQSARGESRKLRPHRDSGGSTRPARNQKQKSEAGGHPSLPGKDRVAGRKTRAPALRPKI